MHYYSHSRLVLCSLRVDWIVFKGSRSTIATATAAPHTRLQSQHTNHITQHTRGRERGRKMWCFNEREPLCHILAVNSTISSFSYFSFVRRWWKWRSVYLVAIIVRSVGAIRVCVCARECTLWAAHFLFLHCEKVNDFASTQYDIVPFAFGVHYAALFSRNI